MGWCWVLGYIVRGMGWSVPQFWSRLKWIASIDSSYQCANPNNWNCPSAPIHGAEDSYGCTVYTAESNHSAVTFDATVSTRGCDHHHCGACLHPALEQLLLLGRLRLKLQACMPMLLWRWHRRARSPTIRDRVCGFIPV